MTESIYNSKEYKRSRKAYVVQCAFEYFISILVTDAFLAKLLTNVGLSDAMIGIISSLISFSFLFQFLSIWMVNRIRDTKRTVMVFKTVSQLFFMAIYLVPFLSCNIHIKTVVIYGCVITAYFFYYLVVSIGFKWANAYVAPEKRATYSAVKEMVSLLTGIAFTLIAGFVVDRYEGLGNISGGFLFIAITILVLNIFNFISLAMIKKDCESIDESDNINKRSFSDVIKNTLGNRYFLNVIIMTSVWEVARYLVIGFLGVFKTNDLLISVGMVQVINMVANLCRLGISMPFGRYSDRHSYSKGYTLAFIIAALAFGVNTFTTKNTWWCIVIFTVLYNMSLAGVEQNAYNITYSYVNKDYIVQAMAIKNSIGGLLGFVASIVGSKILTMVQNNGNTFMGIPMYGQQLLSAISVMLIIVAIIFNKKVVEKQKVMLQ